MTDFKTFCERYGYNPDTDEARQAYREAWANLNALYGAAAQAEASEAITRAAGRGGEA